MRKILFFALISLLAFAACKKDKPQFQINGKVVSDSEGKVVYLKQLDEKLRPGTVIDSAVIKDGAFSLKGNVSHPDFYNISIKDTKLGMNVIVENMPIQVSIDTVSSKNTITGSALNDLYSSYLSEMRTYQTKTQEVNKRANETMQSQPDGKLTEEQRAGFMEEMTKLEEARKEYQQKFMSENKNSLVTAYAFRSLVNGLGAKEIEEHVNQYDSIVGKSVYVAYYKEAVEKMNKTAIGQKFVDIKLPNTDGQMIALSDYAGKGKYVLIDFWASWCGPCRRENPNVVKLYEQYKDKGFEIVGVSLDQNKEAWLKGIADDKITWPQMSDLKYWDSEGADLYWVKSIPSTVLLDKEGIIIAKNLRGEELVAKVAELVDAK